MLPRVITQEVKDKVYEVTQEAFEIDGRVETERVRALLEENCGICFFNTIELEKLIKEGLDKQIFAYKDKMYASIDRNERQSDETIKISQELDVLIVAEMRLRYEKC